MKYTQELAIVAVIAALGLALAVQTHRLAAAQNETVAVQLAFDTYKVVQQAEVLRDQQKELERFKSALQTKEQNNEQLKNQVNALRGERDNALSLRNTANAHLRQARENASNGTCEQAREAARVCTDLYGELEAGAEEAKRRASIYSEYSDRNVIELDACMAYQ